MNNEWQSILTAPRDGTPVELKNTYGIMPTWSLCRWEEPRGWVYTDGSGRGVIDGSHLTWRGYTGDPAAYVDPTGGAQDTLEYWTGGRRHGPLTSAPLPAPHAAHNIQFTDISAQVYGKYQHCTLNPKDGKWYSDQDYDVRGKLKPGTVPSPHHKYEESEVPYDPWVEGQYLFWSILGAGFGILFVAGIFR